jgi:hypothetical protein
MSVMIDRAYGEMPIGMDYGIKVHFDDSMFKMKLPVIMFDRDLSVLASEIKNSYAGSMRRNDANGNYGVTSTLKPKFEELYAFYEIKPRSLDTIIELALSQDTNKPLFIDKCFLDLNLRDTVIGKKLNDYLSLRYVNSADILTEITPLAEMFHTLIV